MASTKLQPKQPLHSEMIIKVCGMQQPDNIAAVAALSPMLMGFIFYEKSPRYAGELQPATIKDLPPYIRPVAVFVDANSAYIREVCDTYGFKIVQLHGHETPEFCAKLRSQGLTVFKSAAITSRDDLLDLQRYVGTVDLFVFDTKGEQVNGGTGQKWDWTIIRNYPPEVPYLLSGGIGPDDIDSIVASMQPGMAGIDINSRFESAPGVKNISLLTNFILSLRKFNENEPPTIPVWEKK
jgi:phosphoribosylanthranilate isomerase